MLALGLLTIGGDESPFIRDVQNVSDFLGRERLLRWDGTFIIRTTRKSYPRNSKRLSQFNHAGEECVILADEDKTKLIFSEKEASWSKTGAFVHLRFLDGLYHLTGLIHISEVSWDLVQDVRDFLTEGDEVRVKVINIDRWKKSRITLSIKQLEEDPLLETLDKVIPQDGLADSDSLSGSGSSDIEPLQGLETIFEELLQEDGS
ncbi:hypothetical protein OROGR_001599 [Orobanche gracilis]